MKTEYRRLEVREHDKHGRNVEKRRRGSQSDRWIELRDSALEQSIIYGDRDGDDHGTFYARALSSFMLYLNQLGAEGWELHSWTPELEISTGAGGGYGKYLNHPQGWHLLTRKVSV